VRGGGEEPHDVGHQGYDVDVPEQGALMNAEFVCKELKEYVWTCLHQVSGFQCFFPLKLSHRPFGKEEGKVVMIIVQDGSSLWGDGLEEYYTMRTLQPHAQYPVY
jgi:hypothetical protein